MDNTCEAYWPIKRRLKNMIISQSRSWGIIKINKSKKEKIKNEKILRSKGKQGYDLHADSYNLFIKIN